MEIEQIVEIVKKSFKHTIRSPYSDALEVVNYDEDLIRLNNHHYFKVNSNRDHLSLCFEHEGDEEVAFSVDLCPENAHFRLAEKLDQEVLFPLHKDGQRFRKMEKRMNLIKSLRDSYHWGLADQGKFENE